MASRNFAQVAPTAATIALNAYIYGYGGHSLVTPHAGLKQLWWTDARIHAKVTRSFVLSQLRGEERAFLDRPLAFGDGLTDDTYIEWILRRAKRLFLILAEIGVPDQIFGCIDDSWDDDDLPLPLDNVASLELSSDNDHALNRKFYDMQFVYLLRELHPGAHIEYGQTEHIPMEHVNTLPPAVCLQPYHRVHFPGRPDEVYMRRKFVLKDPDTGESHHDKWLRDVQKAQELTHEHVARCWASYTSGQAGFVVSDFVAEHSLGTFIDHRTPTQFLRVPAARRPLLLCEWMHCLADALASLHHRGVPHTQIRPSNIWITKENKIAFADVGSLPTLQRGKKSPKTEAYDYAAPESNLSRRPVTWRSTPPPVSSMNALSKLKKRSAMSVSTVSRHSTSGSSSGGSTRSSSICAATIGAPTTPRSWKGRADSLTTPPPTIFSLSLDLDPPSPRSMRNFSRVTRSLPSPTIPSAPGSPASQPLLLHGPTTIDPDTLTDLPRAAPEMGDIWSLACVFLDILTFMLHGKTNDFVKHRSSRPPGGGAARKHKPRPDTSFHSEPDRIATWIVMLEDESLRHGAGIYRGVPALLALVRRMMAQNATLRPTAVDVRDRIRDILTAEGGLDAAALCCAGRPWPDPVLARPASPRRPSRRTDSPHDVDDDTAARPPAPRPPCSRPSQTAAVAAPATRPRPRAAPRHGARAVDRISLPRRPEPRPPNPATPAPPPPPPATPKWSRWKTRLFHP